MVSNSACTRARLRYWCYDNSQDQTLHNRHERKHLSRQPMYYIICYETFTNVDPVVALRNVTNLTRAVIYCRQSGKTSWRYTIKLCCSHHSRSTWIVDTQYVTVYSDRRLISNTTSMIRFTCGRRNGPLWTTFGAITFLSSDQGRLGIAYSPMSWGSLRCCALNGIPFSPITGTIYVCAICSTTVLDVYHLR